MILWQCLKKTVLLQLVSCSDSDTFFPWALPNLWTNVRRVSGKAKSLLCISLARDPVLAGIKLMQGVQPRDDLPSTNLFLIVRCVTLIMHRDRKSRVSPLRQGRSSPVHEPRVWDYFSGNKSDAQTAVRVSSLSSPGNREIRFCSFLVRHRKRSFPGKLETRVCLQMRKIPSNLAIGPNGFAEQNVCDANNVPQMWPQKDACYKVETRRTKISRGSDVNKPIYLSGSVLWYEKTERICHDNPLTARQRSPLTKVL